MSGEPVSIIPATGENQLARIAELAGQIWRVHYPGIISPAQIEHMLGRMYSLETLGAEVRSQGVRFYQIFAGDRLTGFASIGPAGQPGVFKLHKLYVCPEVHGHGLGKRLLHHCEAEAARAEARRLILVVNKSNAKAIAFYQRNDFVIVESVVNDIGGGFVMDDFIMGKDVGNMPGFPGHYGKANP